MREENTKLGVSSLLNDTIIDNTINTSSYFLSKKYYQQWMKSFLSVGRIDRCVEEEFTHYNIFARGHTTVFVTFVHPK